MSRCSASRRSTALAAFSMSASSGEATSNSTASFARLVMRPILCFRRTPPDAVIKVAKAVSVFDGKRGLSDPAHALHGGSANLGHGCRFVAGENGVEPVERIGTTCEPCPHCTSAQVSEIVRVRANAICSKGVGRGSPK